MKKIDKSAIKGLKNEKQTPFSNSEFFQNKISQQTTIEKLGYEEIDNILKAVNAVGKTDMFENSKMLFEILKIESRNKTQLEKLAIKQVKSQFGLKDEIINKIHIKLTDNFYPTSEAKTKNKKSKAPEFNKEQKEVLEKLIEKRKIQNALIMGAGYLAHSTLDFIKEDLDKIDKKLYSYYKKLMPNLSLCMWQYPIEDMMNNSQFEQEQGDFAKFQSITGSFSKFQKELTKFSMFQQALGGLSKLKIDKDGNLLGEAKAFIFPLLLHETIKVSLELLFSNYIIDVAEKYGQEMADEMINAADVFENEIWMKRIGPPMWRYLHNVVDYVILHDRKGNYELFSHIIYQISLMKPDKFKEFMNTIIYDGTNSIVLINKMIDEVEKDIQPEVSNLKQLQNELNDAVKSEDFERALKLKNEIQKLDS